MVQYCWFSLDSHRPVLSPVGEAQGENGDRP
jgi:hypothetical protein